MTAPVRFPRFFVTTPTPCPYLPGKSERKVFTELKRPQRGRAERGARPDRFPPQPDRSPIARRCLDCHACVSVRVVADRVRSHARPSASSSSATATSSQRLQAVGDRRAISSCCSAISPNAIPAAAWRRWTRATLPTWSNTRRSRSYVIEYREPSVTARPGQAGRRLPDRPAGRRAVDDLQLLRPRSETRARASAPTSSSTTSGAPREPGCPMSTSAIGSKARRAWPTRRPSSPLERLGRDGWRRMDAPEPVEVVERPLPTRTPRRILLDA